MKFNINKLVAHKDLTAEKLKSFGFSSNIPNFYYDFKVISQHKFKNGTYSRETLNMENNNIILDSIDFIDETCLNSDRTYYNYFSGKIDYSMLEEYYKAGVKLAESILQEYIDNKILAIKED